MLTSRSIQLIIRLFQVIAGGNRDIDLTISGPNGKILHSGRRKQSEVFRWTTSKFGENRFCFSNEFSSFTHKKVFFDFQVEDEELKQKTEGMKETNMTLSQVCQFCDIVTRLISCVGSVTFFYNSFCIKPYVPREPWKTRVIKAVWTWDIYPAVPGLKLATRSLTSTSPDCPVSTVTPQWRTFEVLNKVHTKQ